MGATCLLGACGAVVAVDMLVLVHIDARFYGLLHVATSAELDSAFVYGPIIGASIHTASPLPLSPCRGVPPITTSCRPCACPAAMVVIAILGYAYQRRRKDARELELGLAYTKQGEDPLALAVDPPAEKDAKRFGS